MRSASWFRENLGWAIHNLIAHPLSEVLFWCGLRSWGDRLHDATVPPHKPGTGRG